MNQTLCYDKYKDYNDSWCGPIFDNWHCWPPTPPGKNISMNCPAMEGSIANRVGYRTCGLDGRWVTFHKSREGSNGSTTYKDCFLSQLKDLAEMCDNFGEHVCNKIAANLRIIEMIGLSLSIISLVTSLVIFLTYSVLRNNRTRIHINLYIASLLHTSIRMIMYIDQSSQLFGTADYVRNSFSAVLEYARTTMFMWMFIEGLYLHNMITVTVFQEYSYIKLYFYIGWTVPAIISVAWLLTMIILDVLGTATISWKYYYFLPYYWILEGPRSIIIVVNMLFLLNIIRVLVVKLRETRTGEIEQVRKAVRAVIFLLPLLGIPHVLFLIDYRVDMVWKFALWSYVTYTLNSFQGLFVAVLYCFLNGEVQTAIKNSINLHMSLRSNDYISCKNLTTISGSQDEDKNETRNYKTIWIEAFCKKSCESADDNKTEEFSCGNCDLQQRRNTTVVFPLIEESEQL